MTPPSLPTRERPALITSLGYFIFFSRWLQAPLYVGLVAAQLVHVYQLMVVLWHVVEVVVLGHEAPAGMEAFSSEAVTMLLVLGLVDVVMISTLLIMVIVAGYETFVSRLRIQDHPDQPVWLIHVNANVLKTKLAMSIIGTSSIHLLRTFIESGYDDVPAQTLMWQTLIHLAFIVSALALAWIDRMSAQGPRRRHQDGSRSRSPSPSVRACPPT